MTAKEKFTVSGSQFANTVKQFIYKGNIRKVRLLHEGRTVFEIPLTVGTPAAAIVILATPILVVPDAFTTMRTGYTIDVEKIEKP